MIERSIIGFLVLAIWLSLISCSETGAWPNKRFEENKWRSTPEADRYIFVRDLIDSKLLIGRSVEQVIGLLGKPSSEANMPMSMQYIVKLKGESFNQVYLLDIYFGGANGGVTVVGVRGD